MVDAIALFQILICNRCFILRFLSRQVPGQDTLPSAEGFGSLPAFRGNASLRIQAEESKYTRPPLLSDVTTDTGGGLFHSAGECNKVLIFPDQCKKQKLFDPGG